MGERRGGNAHANDTFEVDLRGASGSPKAERQLGWSQNARTGFAFD